MASHGCFILNPKYRLNQNIHISQKMHGFWIGCVFLCHCEWDDYLILIFCTFALTHRPTNYTHVVLGDLQINLVWRKVVEIMLAFLRWLKHLSQVFNMNVSQCRHDCFHFTIVSWIISAQLLVHEPCFLETQ